MTIAIIRYIGYVYGASIAAYSIFKKLNESIIYSNIKFFDENPSGKIINRLSNDILVTDD